MREAHALVMPAFERMKESHFLGLEGRGFGGAWWAFLPTLKRLVARPCGEGGSGGEREKGDDLVEASWGFDPQASGGHEIVRDGVPERVGLRFDETANWKKTEAVVLAVCV